MEWSGLDLSGSEYALLCGDAGVLGYDTELRCYSRRFERIYRIFLRGVGL